MSKIIGGQKRGKENGYRHYHLKGVEGTVVARINEGMSSRVKTAAEYANTRLNNAEFGAAGAAAGALLRALPMERRSVLKAFPAAMLGKDFKSIISMQTTAAWGQRGFAVEGWQKMVVDAMNKLNKNSFIGNDGIVTSVTKSENQTIKLNLDIDDAWGSEIESQGADGAKFVYFSCTANMPTYDPDTKKHSVPTITFSQIGEVSINVGEGDSVSESIPGTESYAPVANSAVFGLLVMLPYRTINSANYVLQELCEFRFMHI